MGAMLPPCNHSRSLSATSAGRLPQWQAKPCSSFRKNPSHPIAGLARLMQHSNSNRPGARSVKEGAASREEERTVRTP